MHKHLLKVFTQSSHPDTVDFSPWHWGNSATPPFQQIFFTTQNPGGHVIRSDQWVSPPDNPTTRKEKEREPGYEVNLNFPKRLPKLVSCVFFLSRASWIDTRDCLTASSFCCFDYECVSEYVERVLTGKKKSTQAKLKKHKRFLIFLCCTLLIMQGYAAWTPILILSFSVLMHTT